MTAEIIPFPTRPRFSENDIILMRLKGVKAQPGTAETDADPNNPNAKSEAS